MIFLTRTREFLNLDPLGPDREVSPPAWRVINFYRFLYKSDFKQKKLDESERSAFPQQIGSDCALFVVLYVAIHARGATGFSKVNIYVDTHDMYM